MNRQPQEEQGMEETMGSPLEREPIKNPLKKKPLLFIIPGVLVFLLVGFLVVKAQVSTNDKNKPDQKEEIIEETLAQADASIEVDLTKSNVKDNTVVITVKGLGGKYVSIGYELQYESGGVGKGVTSGSKPLDVTGQDTFEREIYLGTCSKNVCKPDLGVTKIDLVLEFTDKDAKKSQFSKEFEL